MVREAISLVSLGGGERVMFSSLQDGLGGEVWDQLFSVFSPSLICTLVSAPNLKKSEREWIHPTGRGRVSDSRFWEVMK